MKITIYCFYNCREIEASFDCLEDFLYKCHSDSQIQLLSIRDAYDFICVENGKGKWY